MAKAHRYDPFDPVQNDSEFDPDSPPPVTDYWTTGNPWDTFWAERTAGLDYRPNKIAHLRKIDTMLNAPYASGGNFPPRPDVPIEDQRGLSLAELDLQAQFQKARGLGPWAESGMPFDPAAPLTPMARAIGAGDTEAAAKEIALKHAGDILSMHAPEATKTIRKVIKKKEVK